MPQLQLVAAPPAHTEPAWQVSWNPKRNLLASCSTDRTIRFYSYSLPTPNNTAEQSHQHGPGCSHGHTADALALPNSAKPTVNFQTSVTTEHKRTVRSIAWSPSGQTLATGSFDSTVGLWAEVDPDAEDEGGNGKEGVYKPLKGGAEDEEDGDVSMDGQNGEGKSGKEWECVTTLEGHESECKAVAWSADGALLASCSRDKSVWVWELQPDSDFECIAVMMEHSQDVKHLAWHPHEEILASASYDSHINLQWDDPDGDWCTFQKLHPKLPITALSIPNPAAPSAPTIASPAENNDESKSDPTSSIPPPAASSASPGAIVSFNALAAALMPTQEEQQAIDHLNVPPLLEDETVWSLVFSPCGRYMASGGDLGGVRIWARTGQNPDSPFVEVLHTAAHSRSVFSLSWTDAGSSASDGGLGLLASGAGDGKIIIFQISTDPPASLDVDANLEQSSGVIAGAKKNVPRVKATPVAAARDAHGVADVNSVAWLEREDGKGRGVLASCADDGSVRVWRVVLDE